MSRKPLILALFSSAGLGAAALAAQASDAPERVRSKGFPEQALHLENRLFLTKGQADEAYAAGLIPRGTKSVLRVPKALRHGEFRWTDSDVPPGRLLIRVDLDTQLISVFRGGHEIGTSVILYGAEGYKTPLGTHVIKAKMRDHRSSTYDAAMPYTLRLTEDGVAIHASDVRSGAATHGCIGVPASFAEHLFAVARVGDQVEVVSSGVGTPPRA